MPRRAPLTLRASGIGPFAQRPLAHVAVGLDDAARDGEHERHRQVGDLVVEDVRRVRDGDAALARRGDVDAVVADAEHRDDLERGSCAISSRGTFDSPLAAIARMRGATAAKAAASLWWMRSCTGNAPRSDSIIGGQSLAAVSTSIRSVSAIACPHMPT